MENVRVDFSKALGKIKPMHAVNNGPAGSVVRKTSNAYLFQEASIPYARTHDSAACGAYGGVDTVDVHRIFKDFSADENDPASYDFAPTDGYMKSMVDAGIGVFYRLGAMIEHGRKKGTYPPADFHKWARICEHIIRHYNEGWGNGFYYNIEYWEIWNEPDCRNADGSNPCWQGTEEQFIEFFSVVTKYLKSTFPHLKIGGPAWCTIWGPNEEMLRRFLAGIRENGVEMDFFSYHWYGRTPGDIVETMEKAAKMAEQYGYGDCELYLNEWNYVRGWIGEDMMHSLRLIRDERGCAFTTSVMCIGQRNDVDMLMYYDARPCAYSGLWDAFTYEPFKAYYSVRSFGELYRLGTEVAVEGLPSGVYAVAAKGESGVGFLMAYFSEQKNAPEIPVTVTLEGAGEREYAVFVTDAEKTGDKPLLATPKSELTLTLKPNTTVFVRG